MAALVPRKTKVEAFTEAMDEIMDLFYRPQRGNTRHYCCKPEDIGIIMKLVDDLEKCGGDIITFNTNVIPDNEIDDCVNKDVLPEPGTFLTNTLSSKMMYICVILCYYISSRIAGSYSFGVQRALKRLIPGQDAQSIVFRSTMSVMISERLLFNKGNPPECEEIINEFKRNLMTISDFPEKTIKKWASYAPKTEAEFASEVAKLELVDEADLPKTPAEADLPKTPAESALPKTPAQSASEIDEKTKLVLDEQRDIIKKYLQRKTRVSSGGKRTRRKNKSRKSKRH
jgi:hypothetical protein